MKKKESICKFELNKNIFKYSLKNNLNHKKRRKTNKCIVAFLNSNNNCHPIPSDRYPRPCPRNRRAHVKAQKNDNSKHLQGLSPLVNLEEISYLEEDNIDQKPKTFPRLRLSRTSNLDWEPNISDFDQVEKELEIENQESKVLEKINDYKNSLKKNDQKKEFQKAKGIWNETNKFAETAENNSQITEEFINKFKNFLGTVDKRIFIEKEHHKMKEPHHWNQDKNYQELLVKQGMRLKTKINSRVSPYDNLKEMHHLNDIQHFLNSVEAQLYNKNQLTNKDKLKNIKTVKKKLESVYQQFIVKSPFDSLLPTAPQNTESKIMLKSKLHKLTEFNSDLFSKVHNKFSSKNFMDFEANASKPTISEPTLSQQDPSTNITVKPTSSNMFQKKKYKTLLNRPSTSMASLMLNSRVTSSTSFFSKDHNTLKHFTDSNHKILKKLIELTSIKLDKYGNKIFTRSNLNESPSKCDDEQQHLKELSQQQKQLQQQLNHLKVNKSGPTSKKNYSKISNTNTFRRDYITLGLNDHAAIRRKQSRLYLRQQQELQRKLQQLETQQNLKFQELLRQQREQLVELQALKNIKKKPLKIKSPKVLKDPPPTAPVTLYSIICQRSMSVPPVVQTSDPDSKSVLIDVPLCIKDVENKEAVKTTSEPAVQKKYQDAGVMAKLQVPVRKKNLYKDFNLIKENWRNHHGQNMRMIKKKIKQRQKVQVLPRKKNPNCYKPSIKVPSIISLPPKTFNDSCESAHHVKNSCESVKVSSKQSSNSFATIKSFSSAKISQVKWSKEEKMDDDEVSRIFFQDDPPIHFLQRNFEITDTDLQKENGVMWEETNRRKVKLISRMQSQCVGENEVKPTKFPTKRGIPKYIGRSVPVITSHSGSTLEEGNNSIEMANKKDQKIENEDGIEVEKFTQGLDTTKSDGVMQKFLEYTTNENHIGFVKVVENPYQDKKEEMVVKEWMANDPPSNESRSITKMDEDPASPPMTKDDAMPKLSTSSRSFFSQTFEDPLETRKKLEEKVIKSISSYKCFNAPVPKHTFLITSSECLGMKECDTNSMTEKINRGLMGGRIIDEMGERESRSKVRVMPCLESSTDNKIETMAVNESCMLSIPRTVSRTSSRREGRADTASKITNRFGSKTASSRIVTEFERMADSRTGRDEVAVREGRIGRGGRLNSLEPLNSGKRLLMPLTENNFKTTQTKSDIKLRGILRDSGPSPLTKVITHKCKENVDEQCKRFFKHFDSVTIEDSFHTSSGE